MCTGNLSVKEREPLAEVSTTFKVETATLVTSIIAAAGGLIQFIKFFYTKDENGRVRCQFGAVQSDIESQYVGSAMGEPSIPHRMFVEGEDREGGEARTQSADETEDRTRMWEQASSRLRCMGASGDIGGCDVFGMYGDPI